MSKRLVLSLFALAVLAGPLAAAEGRGRRDVLATVAKSIKNFLEGREASEVRLGTVEGDKQPPSNAGPGLCIEIGQLLAGLKVTVTDKARFEMRGHYRLIQDGETKRLVVELKTWIVDRTRKGAIVVRLREVDFQYIQDFAPVLGLTLALDSEASDGERDKVIRESRDDERKAPASGTKVLAAPRGKFAVELLKRNARGTYEALPPASRKGSAFVTLGTKDVYALRLSNDSRTEAAAEVFIDGLNVFTFGQLGDAKKGYPRLLVPAGKSMTIRGWPITLKESREFQVAAYPKTAAFTQGIGPGSLGVISATFAPVYEPGKRPKGFRSAPGPYGTGFGAPINTPFEQVRREFGPVQDCITLRYTVE